MRELGFRLKPGLCGAALLLVGGSHLPMCSHDQPKRPVARSRRCGDSWAGEYLSRRPDLDELSHGYMKPVTFDTRAACGRV